MLSSEKENGDGNQAKKAKIDHQSMPIRQVRVNLQFDE